MLFLLLISAMRKMLYVKRAHCTCQLLVLLIQIIVLKALTTLLLVMTTLLDQSVTIQEKLQTQCWRQKRL